MDLNEFISYKKYYTNPPDELTDHIENVKLQPNKNKKIWKKTTGTNWMIKKKSNQDETDKLESNFKAILNKIGENNFIELSNELLQLDIDTSELLHTLVSMIFVKAIKEIKFITVYVKLCEKLFNKYITNENGTKIFFRSILLEKIQSTFISCLETDTEEDLKKFGLRDKKEFNGLVKFMGELYNYNLLTSAIICHCQHTLITEIEKKKWYAIDILCILVSTTIDKFKKNCHQDYIAIKTIIEALAFSTNIKTKDKFALLDILDL